MPVSNRATSTVDVQPVSLAIPDAARRHGLSLNTVRYAISRGLLPAYRIPGTRVVRVRIDELDALFVRDAS
jgi:excisionase family DNA binding protein